MVKIYFLGTSASKPTKHRGMPSILLQIENEFLLLDCGEGTQRQIIQAGINPNKIKYVLITHLHGDHVFGLAGLIWSMGLDLRREDLYVYGPRGILNFLELLDKISSGYREYKVIVKEISEGKVFETKNFEVFSLKVKHSVEAYAYKIKEKDKPPKILKEKLKELNIPEGPHLRELKKGKTINIGGRIIKPEDVLGEPVKGKVIVYTGDTAYFEPLIEFCKDADVLIHEATYGDDEESKAHEYLHSTARLAARIAKNANVKLLILTHISARYEEGMQLVFEAKEEFENTIIAKDFLVIDV